MKLRLWIHLLVSIIFFVMIANGSISITYESKSHKNIQIVSPTSNSSVLINTYVTISGTSSDSPFNDCKVLLEVNNSTLSAMPIGRMGLDDYSVWQISLSPFNGTLREGQNEIT